MAAERVIEVRDLVKDFRRVNIKGGFTSLKSVLLNPFAAHRHQGPRLLHVLKGLNFRASQGEMVGLIGRNGSGKSTLLKLMAGIYKATSGRVRISGRLSALIELGAGFHPEFSGRENIFLYGIILGLGKEDVRARYDRIVAFAELSDYIDSPVRTYSSGMYVRLGFSVAVNTDPDILLIDEVMAVGDAGFKRKCEAKIAEFKQAGKTIVLVSHDLDEVERFCDRVVWLHEGIIQADGPPAQVIQTYRDFIASQDGAGSLARPGSDRWGEGPIRLRGLEVVDRDGQPRTTFRPGEPLAVRIAFSQDEDRPGPGRDLAFGVALTRADGTLVFGTNTHLDGLTLENLPGSGRVELNLERLDLTNGLYYLDAAVHTRDGRPFDYWTKASSFTVRSDLEQDGIYRPPHTWTLP